MDLEYVIDKLIKEINLEIRMKDKKTEFYILQTLEENFLIRIITPHEGNNFTFIIRAEYMECMDKWSNSTYQRLLENKIDLMITTKDLKNMIKYRKKILVKEWDCYSEEYQYDINEKEYDKVLKMRW